jgi:hypothetical protein
MQLITIEHLSQAAHIGSPKLAKRFLAFITTGTWNRRFTSAFSVRRLC